jgi:hypothetical protein
VTAQPAPGYCTCGAKLRPDGQCSVFTWEEKAPDLMAALRRSFERVASTREGLRGVITPASLGVMTQNKRTVRIHVDTSVEIDVQAWLDNYGDDLTENPADARDYIENVIREQLKSVGVLA